MSPSLRAHALNVTEDVADEQHARDETEMRQSGLVHRSVIANHSTFATRTITANTSSVPGVSRKFACGILLMLPDGLKAHNKPAPCDDPARDEGYRTQSTCG